MKILHVGSPFTDFMGNFGLIFKISKGLIEKGHKVTIITTDGDCFYFDKEKSDAYKATREKLKGNLEKPIFYKDVPVYALRCTKPSLGMYSPDAVKFGKKIIKEYDVVHLCTWYNHLTMSFAKVAYNLGVPYVISSWGTILPRAKQIKGKQKFIADLIYSKFLKNASAFQSVGDSETEEFLRLGAKSEQVFRMDNPVNQDDFIMKECTGLLKKHMLENKNFLLFVGRINEKKGLELLLDSFKKNLDTHGDLILVIAGSGEKYYQEKILDYVRELKISKNIKFLGLVSDQEKLELLKYAKLFVLTSHSDVHPIAVQDSLAMGLPVVITEACDYPEVTKYDAGIVVQPEINSVVNGINKMLERNDLEKCGENAKKLIAENFSLETQIKRYGSMYEFALKQKNLIM